MPPLQENRVLVQRQRLELEVVKERRGQPDSVADQTVFSRSLLSQEVEKRRQVGAVGTQETVVVQIAGSLDR